MCNLYAPYACVIQDASAVEFGLSVETLLQSGMSLYDQGRLTEAQGQFKKVLLLNPRSAVAKEFLMQIEQDIHGKRGEAVSSRVSAIQEALDSIQRGFRGKPEPVVPTVQPAAPTREKQEVNVIGGVREVDPLALEPTKSIAIEEVEQAGQTQTPLSINKNEVLLLRSCTIKRFLNTAPDILAVERKSDDSVVVLGKQVGQGIFHVWDHEGRHTFVLKVEQEQLIKDLKKISLKQKFEEALSRPFVISYSLDRATFHSGRRVDETRRQSISISQSVGVRGETPYGDYDTSLSIDRLNDKSYEIGSLTMGLSDAHFWGLEHMNWRIFDFGTGIPSFKFPNASLRGIRYDAPMFNATTHVTTFWGGLEKGSYSNLSPGLGNTIEAYLEGIALDYRLRDWAQYKLFYAHSYGEDLNQPEETNDVLGLGMFYTLGRLKLDYEIANDTINHNSYTTGAHLSLPKTTLYARFTENDGEFGNVFGGEPATGNAMLNLGLSHSFNESFTTSDSLSVMKDNEFYNPDDPSRLNYSLNSSFSWRVDPVTSLSTSYSRIDNKGSISPTLSESKQISLNREVFFIKRVNTYVNFVNSTDKNYTGSGSNYDRNSIRGGLSFGLFDDWIFNINKTYNFVRDRISDDHSSPEVLEMGLSSYSRFGQSPFYGNFRVFYRDEEDAESAISFLSGEDRLEFQAGLDYRPKPGVDAYLSARCANVWAENQSTQKHFDIDVRTGMRIAWDTGFRWNTRGNVDGFVFFDENGDGIRSDGEDGVADVSIKAAIDKEATTNDQGYYKITDIHGKKATIAIDMNSVPRGYNLSTPANQDVQISHRGTRRIDFGLATRCEIIGIIFIDVNNNNVFDRKDEVLSGVTLTLDDDQHSITDSSGQFFFRRLSPGQHTLRLDLKTLSTEYIPKVSIKKTIELKKGESFFYNIPLRTAKVVLDK